MVSSSLPGPFGRCFRKKLDVYLQILELLQNSQVTLISRKDFHVIVSAMMLFVRFPDERAHHTLRRFTD